MMHSRRAFTIIELLVVISIIGVLIGLLLPAVQHAREAARRVQCQNNLKQIGLALASYEGTHRSFPQAAYVAPGNGPGGEVKHSWLPGILPYLEQTSLVASYNEDACFCASENYSVVRRALAVFTCPSAPGSRETTLPSGTVAIASYHPVSQVHPMLVEYLLNYGHLTENAYQTVFHRDAQSGKSRAVRAADIRDGLSNTWTFVEADGAPRRWHDNHPHSAPFVRGGSPWDPESAFILHGVDHSGTSPGPLVFVTNGGGGLSDFDLEPFSFHRGVVHALRADGGVDSVSREMTLPLVVQRLAINDGGF